VRLTKIYFAMLTLAFAQIVWAICFKWNDLTGGDQGLPVRDAYRRLVEQGWTDGVRALHPVQDLHLLEIFPECVRPRRRIAHRSSLAESCPCGAPCRRRGRPRGARPRKVERPRARLDRTCRHRSRRARSALTTAEHRSLETEMNDGPIPDDFRAKVFRDRKHTGDWRVEKLLDDGESSEVVILSGGDARQRAIR
jgi:hypothetical protein